jgi:transposase
MARLKLTLTMESGARIGPGKAALLESVRSSGSISAAVLDKIRRRFPWLELIWADGGYNAWQVDAAAAKVPLLRVEIVKRSDDMKGFVVLPRRWVVERTFSWFGRNRRLAKDIENLAETLATFVTLASIQLALRRLARA